MKVEILETHCITSYVGVRATEEFSNLGQSIGKSFSELFKRKDEITNIINPSVTYGISPPNYKGNKGKVDFYCSYEVSSVANVPHGMVHIHILPRVYSVTHYIGPRSETDSGYEYTSQWLSENGYTYDDSEYYFERHDDGSIVDQDDEIIEMKIYSPVKKG